MNNLEHDLVFIAVFKCLLISARHISQFMTKWW